jgi:hypothetical protein
MIAENGDPSSAVSMLAGSSGLADLVTVDAPIHRQGGLGSPSYTLRISALAKATSCAVPLC